MATGSNSSQHLILNLVLSIPVHIPIRVESTTVELISRELAHSARAVLAHGISYFSPVLTVYPPLEDNGASLARPDHRKSKFGLRHAIIKLN